MKETILVKWGRDRTPSGRKGTAVPYTGLVTTQKIIFPERSFDSSKLGADVWECIVVTDTMPNSPTRGALIVKPVRSLVWGWGETGPSLWGARDVRYMCSDYPELSDMYAPSDSMRYAELDKVRAPWRAAQEKAKLWEAPLWDAPKFWAVFGAPTALRSGGEGLAILTYTHGEKTVEARLLASSSPVEATGEFRETDQIIEGRFIFTEYSDVWFWGSVGYFGSPGVDLPHTLTLFELLDSATQGEVLSRLRVSVTSPEDTARANWGRRMAGYEGEEIRRARAELEALQSEDEASIEVSRSRQQIGYAEYRAAGSYETWVTTYTLRVGNLQFKLWADTNPSPLTPPTDAENERVKLVDSRRLKVAKGLSLDLPDYPDHGKEITGLSREEWVDHYREAWSVLSATP